MLRLYRGREGMISWALHRLTGLGVLMFLFIHIADIFVIGYGPEQFNDLLFIYHATPFRIMEILLVGAVYYHAFNGIRIILIDFWDGAANYQKQLFYGVIIVFFAAFIPTAIRMGMAIG
ncbi:MAG: succinate dehydrogenase, cytochrome b556 subunit [Chloroflexi bacterium]|nr:MAG: succinate dehydrogenase, cytochrome b556 subunit [Chloroflexota bacterium]